MNVVELMITKCCFMGEKFWDSEKRELIEVKRRSGNYSSTCKEIDNKSIDFSFSLLKAINFHLISSPICHVSS